MTSLNPYMRISHQMIEVLTLHKGMSRRDALAESVRLLDAMEVPEAKTRIGMYPHEFSGGMLQRVLIAMALLCRPRLLIADEPTTALDATVRGQIMRLLADVRSTFDTAVILVTHDVGIVAGNCDEMVVLYGGRVMESGPVASVFAATAPPLYAGSAGRRAAARPGRREAARHPGRSSQHEPAACRLPLRRALPAGGRHLPSRAAGGHPACAGPAGRLPPAPGGCGMSAPLLSVRDLSVTFRVRPRGSPPWTRAQALQGGPGRQLRPRAGRNARHRRRERIGQVDPRPRPDRHGARHRGAGALAGQGSAGDGRRGTPPASPRHPDDLPESARRAGPPG